MPDWFVFEISVSHHSTLAWVQTIDLLDSWLVTRLFPQGLTNLKVHCLRNIFKVCTHTHNTNMVVSFFMIDLEKSNWYQMKPLWTAFKFLIMLCKLAHSWIIMTFPKISIFGMKYWRLFTVKYYLFLTVLKLKQFNIKVNSLLNILSLIWALHVAWLFKVHHLLKFCSYALNTYDRLP
jgi:hypothetical protein